jgi:hypothetical protein
MSPNHSQSSGSTDAKEQRWLAVNDPETAPQDLENIIGDGCHGLVRRAAEHPKATVEILMNLAAHCDPEVRAAVVHNDKTPDELHWQLARDESDDVRYAVAESYRVGEDVLSALLEDDNPYISHRARVTLKKRNVNLCMAAEFPIPAKVDKYDDASDEGGQRRDIAV